eukprot:10975543-Karenia_brevis.AAC.1
MLVVARLSPPGQAFVHGLCLLFCQTHEFSFALVQHKAHGASKLQGRAPPEDHIASDVRVSATTIGMSILQVT